MVTANVRVLGEEADKQDHIPDVSKMVTKKKHNIKLITEPAFLPNTCYVRLWVVKRKYYD